MEISQTVSKITKQKTLRNSQLANGDQIPYGILNILLVRIFGFSNNNKKNDACVVKREKNKTEKYA